MDIEAPARDRVEHRLRQDQPVGDHHPDLGPERGDLRRRLRPLQRRRRPHLEPQRRGPRRHRARPRPLPAPAGPRRPGVDRRHLVPGRDQRLERRHREVRGSHEDEAHGRPARDQARAFSFFSFFIREVIIVRLSPLR